MSKNLYEKMYNKERKQAYIKYFLANCNTTNEKEYEKLLVGFFRRLAKIEKVFDLDFCEFDYETILYAVSLLGTAKSTQKVTISRLAKYVDWCIEKGYTPSAENLVRAVATNTIDTSLHKKMSMIKDEDQLAYYLEETMLPLHVNSRDNILRAVIILLYCGCTFEELLSLKKHDVQIKKDKVIIKGNEVSLSEALCNMLGYYSKMTFMISESKIRSAELKLIDSDLFIRNTSERTEGYESYFKTEVSRFSALIREKLNIRVQISPTNITKSGIFFRIYKDRMRGFGELHDYYVKSKTPEHKRRQMSWGYEEYYEWEEAFHL